MSKASIQSESRTEFIDITEDINKKISIKNGIASIFSKHTTSGLTVNENEEGLIKDMKKKIKELVRNESWKHDKIDNNADSHLRGMFLDSSLCIPVKNSELDLGSWQSVFFVELDGPRTREIKIKTLKE